MLDTLQSREGHLLEAQHALQRATLELEARVGGDRNLSVSQHTHVTQARQVDAEADAHVAQLQAQHSSALRGLQVRLDAAQEAQHEAEARCKTLQATCRALQDSVEVCSGVSVACQM